MVRAELDSGLYFLTAEHPPELLCLLYPLMCGNMRGVRSHNVLCDYQDRFCSLCWPYHPGCQKDSHTSNFAIANKNGRQLSPKHRLPAEQNNKRPSKLEREVVIGNLVYFRQLNPNRYRTAVAYTIWKAI